VTTTLEQEVSEKRNEEVAAFVMTKPCRGQCVTWYSAGTRDCTGEMAFILEIGKRNVVLQRASGLAMESVRHIDDPKLKLSVDQRESGAWDFTDRDKQLDKLQATVNDLHSRFTTLETRLATLEDLIKN
jgi:hypothetical protein